MGIRFARTIGIAAVLAGVVAGLLAPVGSRAARAEERAVDWDDLAELEELALKVELEGYVDGERVRPELALSVLKELPRPKGLSFPTMSNTVATEKDFTRKYLEQYASLHDELAKRCRAAAKDADLLKGITAKEDDGPGFAKEFLKKHPKPEPGSKSDPKKDKLARTTNEIRAVLLRTSEPWALLREKTKNLAGEKLDRELAARVEQSKGLCKKHDYGKDVAQPRLGGSASVHYDLPRWTYDLVRDNLKAFTGKPLTDAKGAPLTWRGKTLLYSPAINVSSAKVAFAEMSVREYYAVQYALKEQVVETGDKERPLLRMTGARLLLGHYQFFEAGDRVIVYLPAAE